MNLSNIKKIVLQEGRVVIIDGDDALVIMSFEEYEKTKRKNIEMASVLLEAKPEPQTDPQPQAEKPARNASSQPAVDTAFLAGIADAGGPVAELTLDDLPF